jgi:hypothetical protein
MGVTYSITCKDCKVTRDLDKFYTSDIYKIETREDALEYREKIEKDSFRAGLLVSFMAKHRTHECVYHSESDCLDEYEPFEDDDGFIEDTDFWKDK